MENYANQASLEQTIAEARNTFEKILFSVTNPHGDEILHEMERSIFTQLLSLGLMLINLFLLSVGLGDIGSLHTDKSGVVRRRHGEKSRIYYSIFGKIKINRLRYWAKGMGEVFPLDAKLNLPKESYSYLLQEWATLMGVQGAWDKVRDLFQNMFSINLWSSSLERIADRASQDIAGFYKSHSEYEYKDEAELLVVTVDGKGVPMKKEEPVQKKVRLKKGEKPGKKKMSTVTAVYTVDRHEREIEEVVKELETGSVSNSCKVETQKRAKKRPSPKNKIVKATLQGKKKAFTDLAQQVKTRDPDRKKEGVALVDGEKKFRELLKQYLPWFCIILDLYHVLEYLWKAAHVFHSEGTKEATVWVQSMLKSLLSGGIEDIIIYLKFCLHHQEFSNSKKKSLKKVIGYLENGKAFMRYDKYLSQGYPIGSGVVEGACKNLVKDRMELSGMHWTEEGAEAMLGLRSISVNTLSKEFWLYRSCTQHESLYGHTILSEGETEQMAA